MNNDMNNDMENVKPLDFNNDIVPMLGNFCIIEYVFAFLTLLAFYFSIDTISYLIVFVLYTLLKLNYFSHIIYNLYEFVESNKID
jgi:hypothetical protein